MPDGRTAGGDDFNNGKAAKTMAMDRETQISNAIRNLQTVHDEWAGDPTSPAYLTEAFEEAVLYAIDVCAKGAIPARFRELISQMARFGECWNRYVRGDRLGDGAPRSELWSALRGVFEAFAGSTAIRTQSIESVAVLRGQGLNDLQIARAYGWRKPLGNGEHRWEGPFFTANETADVARINQEAAEPGSIITADWVHPEEAARVAAENADIENRIQRVAEMASPQEYTDPSSIADHLREGAYPEQVARVRGITVDEVLRVAAAEGIAVTPTPNISALQGTFDHQQPEYQPVDTGAASRHANSGVDDFDTDSVGQAGQAAGGQSGDNDNGRPAMVSNGSDDADGGLDALIIEAAQNDDSLGAAEIAAKLTEELGESVTVQKVVWALRKQKESATAATAGSGA